MAINYAHIQALLLSLVIYALLAGSYYGWGRLVSHIFQLEDTEHVETSLLIWLGWIITLIFLELQHFVLPLRALNVGGTLGIGLLFTGHTLVKHLRNPKKSHRSDFHWKLWLPVIMIGLILTCWVAAKSMLRYTHTDSGIYHHQTMKWFNEYPIVPGLGNLHGRFAYNQSFFVYAAALNFTPHFGHGRSIANSFLFLLTLFTLLNQLFHTFFAKDDRATAHPYDYIPSLLSLPVLLYVATTTNGFASPAPDLAATLIQLIMYPLLIQMLTPGYQDNPAPLKTVTLGLLASTAITIKLSNAALAIAILGYLFITLFKQREARQIRLIFSVSAVIALIWVGRGYLLSGVPFFPSTLGKLPFIWAMPSEDITLELDFIKGWARNWQDWMGSLESTDWIKIWWNKNLNNITEFVYPVILSLLCLMGSIIAKIRMRVAIQPGFWFLPVPAILALVYWFSSAPDIRFAHALFYFLAISATTMLITHIQSDTHLSARWQNIISVLLIILCSANLITGAVINRASLLEVSDEGWVEIEIPNLARQTTASGLGIYIPVGTKKDQQCLDAPLPCTPRGQFDTQLALIDENDLGAGFYFATPEP